MPFCVRFMKTIPMQQLFFLFLILQGMQDGRRSTYALQIDYTMVVNREAQIKTRLDQLHNVLSTNTGSLRFFSNEIHKIDSSLLLDPNCLRDSLMVCKDVYILFADSIMESTESNFVTFEILLGTYKEILKEKKRIQRVMKRRGLPTVPLPPPNIFNTKLPTRSGASCFFTFLY